MHKIAVYEDDKIQLQEMSEILKSITGELGETFAIDCFGDGRELTQRCADLPIDYYSIIFFDIVMKEQGGMSSALKLREMGWVEAKFVFISCHDKFLKELYALDTVGFIDKPFTYASFKKVFMDAYNKLQTDDSEFLIYRKDKADCYVRIRQIAYIEILNRIITLHLKNGEQMDFYSTISELWDILKERRDFVMPTKSFILNLDYIQSVDNCGFHLLNGHLVPIGRKNKEHTMKRYLLYINKRGGYNIGHEAERMVLEGTISNHFSIWYDMKRWVSDYDREEELSDYQGNRLLMKRKEIIRAFLLYVIESAQQRFKCTFRSLFLSYPVKQKARFVSLYQEILPEYEIIVKDAVDEGVAVLYNTIHNYIGNQYYENGAWYKALIIDCGGGTTDLSSCDFSITDERIAYKIKVETSYENGDTDFGGNNLTFRILQLIKIEAARILSGTGKTLAEVTADLEQNCYREVDEQGTALLYAELEKTYIETEKVIPTRFRDYELHGRDEYYSVRNNYYYLFTLAERVKKAFFSDSRLLMVSISSTQEVEDRETVHIDAPRWKLAVNTKNGLELQKDFPAMVLGVSLVCSVLNPDIYDLIRRFLMPIKLEDYSIINLTGQSCKIPLFRDAIKEFIPGRLIRSSSFRNREDYRLKLSCLEGVVRYISDQQLGLTRVQISSKDAALPWQLYTWTHSGEKAVLIHRLDRTKNCGNVFRPLESSRLQIYLENARGEEKHVYTVFSPREELLPATYQDDIETQFAGHILQETVDVIGNGEVRYFIWADTDQWSFTVVPVARWNDTLLLGRRQDFPFENDSWTANFFNGEN